MTEYQEACYFTARRVREATRLPYPVEINGVGLYVVHDEQDRQDLLAILAFLAHAGPEKYVALIAQRPTGTATDKYPVIRGDGGQYYMQCWVQVQLAAHPVFDIIPRQDAKGVYTSPTWERGSQRGGWHHYILTPGSTFHLPGYGGVELAVVQAAYGTLPGHIRWYVNRCDIEYGLAQPDTDDNTKGDWVEQLGAYEYFGLKLP